MNREKEIPERPLSMVDLYYKRFVRIAEYYIIFCFLNIAVIPLFEYAWVPVYIRFIFLTGFVLLLFIFFISFVKDAFLDILKRRFEPTASKLKSTDRE